MASQVPTQANIQSTHPFTCNTCQVAFRSSELQRAHMQTDWHRYNLKRRVASLPPLSSEIFTEKVLANKADAAATAAKASFEKSCTICQKTYFSENAYNNHLNSQKHRTNVMKAGRGAQHDDAASVSGSMVSSAFSLGESMAESDVTVNGEGDKDVSEVVDGIKNASLDADVPALPTDANESTAEDDKSSDAASAKMPGDPLLDCLFCNYKSPNFDLNINHMGRFHGMFVPEREFLVEPENLVKYLHDKIHLNHECLKCHKIVHTPAGIQTHMRDRGHCMIAFETDAELVEVGQFYDFRSSYPDAAEFEDIEDEDASDDSASTQGGGVKLGARREAVVTTGDNAAMSSNEDDAGWETDSTVSSVPTDEIGTIPIDRAHRLKSLNKSKHHNHADPRPHRAADGFHSHAHGAPHAVYHDDYELHLPSGRTAGHRSLNKYYRQNLRNYPGVAERMENAQRRLTAGEGSGEDSDVDMDGEEGEDGEQRNGRGRQQIATRGDMGMLGVSEAKKAEIAAVEKREQRRGQRVKNNYQAGNEKRGNFQKHFRDHLLQ
jgi:pre-60S factor REI1